jgi:hypothetical protein
MDTHERFAVLDENLKLPPAERDKAIAAHQRLGDLLVKAGIAKRTRLQGSFARKTMLPPLKDIDKVIELIDDLAELLKVPGGPEKAMLLIKERIEKAIPNATFEIKKHALGVVLPGDGFDFDAVPAFNDEDGTGWIVIADTEDDDWEPSNTYVLIDTIAARNQLCEGRFVHQVRMAKQAVKEAKVDLPGLHVETFAYNAITTKVDHPTAVARTLHRGAEMLCGPYTEPTGVDRIDTRLDPDQKAAAQHALAALADQADEALRLAAEGDDTGASRIWAGIFGEPFPAPDAMKGVLQDLHAGKALTSLGSITSARRNPTTRAWRP